jgi:hypothetical protein
MAEAAVFGRMVREIGAWKVTLDNWEAQACRIANRDLTDDEWDTYIGDNVKRRNTCMEAK